MRGWHERRDHFPLTSCWSASACCRTLSLLWRPGLVIAVMALSWTRHTAHQRIPMCLRHWRCRLASARVHYGREGRLESVHNAIEGGKLAAAAIMGAPHPDRGNALVLVGPVRPEAADRRAVDRSGRNAWCAAIRQRGSFCGILPQGRANVIAVDAVNSAPGIHCRKEAGCGSRRRVAPAELVDKSISMKDIGARAGS